MITINFYYKKNSSLFLRTFQPSGILPDAETKTDVKGLLYLKICTSRISAIISGDRLHLKNPIVEPFRAYLFHSRKMSGFNDFEAINTSKKRKNINNKQKYLNLFVTEFDKTSILSQFELFFLHTKILYFSKTTI